MTESNRLLHSASSLAILSRLNGRVYRPRRLKCEWMAIESGDVDGKSERAEARAVRSWGRAVHVGRDHTNRLETFRYEVSDTGIYLVELYTINSDK